MIEQVPLKLDFDPAWTDGLCRKLRRAVEHINSNLQDDLTLAALAHMVQMNPQYFARTFKRATGTAPHRYVIERRVEYAKRLLSETELPLAEVAARIGSPDQSHFTTLFRKLTGMTPKAYREQ